MAELKNSIEEVYRDTSSRKIVIWVYDLKNPKIGHNITLSRVNQDITDDKQVIEVAKQIVKLQSFGISTYKESLTTQFNVVDNDDDFEE